MRMLTPWTSKNLTSDFFEDMNKFFDDMATTTTSYDDRSFHPQCEMTETDDQYQMSVDLPGLKKEDIKIELSENILTVSGERRREVRSDKKEKIQRYEKSYGFFKRSFALPTVVEREKISAHFENGVLELEIPKAATAKPRLIEVK